MISLFPSEHCHKHDLKSKIESVTVAYSILIPTLARCNFLQWGVFSHKKCVSLTAFSHQLMLSHQISPVNPCILTKNYSHTVPLTLSVTLNVVLGQPHTGYILFLDNSEWALYSITVNEMLTYGKVWFSVMASHLKLCIGKDTRNRQNVLSKDRTLYPL